MTPIQITGSLASATTDTAPQIDCFLPAEDARNGAGVIIFPGGGYGGRAEHEGAGYATYFAAAGYCAFVVQYRVAPNRHPAPLEDALAAIATVRGRAGEYGIDPEKIGVIGSSAGAHLAAMTLVAHDRYDADVPLRPAFGILCYPVILMRGAKVNAGSRNNLLGENPSDALVDEVSPRIHVSAKTPPCFIWHTLEDTSVPIENSLAFTTALRTHDVSFELHIYEKGRHGLGLNAEFDWGGHALRWLTHRF